MTNRERFLAALNGKPQERLPMVEWADWWDKTVRRWEEEGLPKGLRNPEIIAYWKLDPMLQYWLRSAGGGMPAAQGTWAGDHRG